MLVACPTAIPLFFLLTESHLYSWYVTSLKRSHDLKLNWSLPIPVDQCQLEVSTQLSSGPGDAGRRLLAF